MIGTNGTFDGPTLVQTKAHFYLEARHALLKCLVSLIVQYVSVFVDLCDDFEETE